MITMLNKAAMNKAKLTPKEGRLNVRIPKDELAAFRQYVYANGASISSTMRTIIRDVIKRAERKAKSLKRDRSRLSCQ